MNYEEEGTTGKVSDGKTWSNNALKKDWGGLGGGPSVGFRERVGLGKQLKNIKKTRRY